NLYGLFSVPTERRALRQPAYFRTIFERDRWVHIAWVWGMRDLKSSASKTGRERILCNQLFVNGKPGRPYLFKYLKPHGKTPKTIMLYSSLDSLVDELRISDTQRYTEAFTPPDPTSVLKADANTRALFHFNGDVKGESNGGGELMGVLKR
ncbi:MAG: hypothetical protein QF473_39545, partial [Planctomycetota bacterium]|nr:hypothetical protein [Planctomycetota bacterium]